MPFMLNNIRGALKGVGAWVFVIVGIAAFSVVGVPSLSNFQAKPPIKVGDITISQQKLVDEFNREIRLQQLQSSRGFSREEALATGVQQRVVQTLATRAVMQVEADNLNLAMPRALVRDVLSRNEIFQNKLTGEFDDQVLGRILQQYQMTPRQFDQQIRQDLIQQNLVEAISAGSDAPRSLTDFHLARQTERRQISWLSITDALAGEAVEPAPEDLQTWYDTNPDQYTSQEFRTFSIAFLRNNDFQEGLTADEDELRAIYDANRERLYEEPEKRTIYQITYDTEADAAAVVARLREGTPFETLAQERGLSLEAVTQTQASRTDIVDTSVGEAAFAQDSEPGSILEPIKGLFGSTVVQIVDITPSVTRSFEEVRGDIEAAQLSQQTQQLVYDAVEKIEAARDDGTSLVEAAATANISLQTFGPVDRFSLTPGGAILDGIPVVALEEAFILDEGDDSELIELDNDEGYLILVVDEISEPALKAFDDVKENVERAWRSNERRERIATATGAIEERLANGETLETIAEEFDRAPIREAIDIATRSHDTISETLHTEIFTANKNDVVTGLARDGSVQIVAEVREITYARGSINPAQLQNYRQFIGLQINQELLEAYVNTLQEDYNVEINQPLIDRIFSIDGA